MRMSDVVSHAGLSAFAELALPVALAGFALLLLTLCLPRRRGSTWSDMARIPLEQDEGAPLRRQRHEGTEAPSPGDHEEDGHGPQR